MLCGTVKNSICLLGAKMLSVARFCELCALELKWLPLCRDAVHYFERDCIKRGQLSGTPAAGPKHTHTQYSNMNWKWKYVFEDKVVL